MRRVLILTHERRGSTFLMSMLFGKPGGFAGGKRRFKLEEMQFPIWLNTVPPRQIKFYYHHDPNKHIITDTIMGRPNIDIPEAYTWEPPVDLQPYFYNNLPGDDWRFVYLWRDPRNVISSLLKRSNLAPEGQETLFYTQCQYFKTELNSINAMTGDPRFRLLCFKDLIARPVDTMVDTFQFMGFNIDRSFYQKIADRYTQQGYINTSFRDDGQGSLKRWSFWPQEWLNHYKQEVIPGLQILGIQEYLEWSNGRTYPRHSSDP